MLRSMIRIIKNNENAVFMYGSSFLFGIVGSITIYFFTHFMFSDPVKVGTVNITSLVDRFIKHEAQKNLSKDELQKEVKTFSFLLNQKLNEFSKVKNIVLLPREAVLTGAPDYTNVIQTQLYRQE